MATTEYFLCQHAQEFAVSNIMKTLTQALEDQLQLPPCLVTRWKLKFTERVSIYVMSYRAGLSFAMEDKFSGEDIDKVVTDMLTTGYLLVPGNTRRAMHCYMSGEQICAFLRDSFIPGEMDCTEFRPNRFHTRIRSAIINKFAELNKIAEEQGTPFTLTEEEDLARHRQRLQRAACYFVSGCNAYGASKDHAIHRLINDIESSFLFYDMAKIIKGRKRMRFLCDLFRWSALGSWQYERKKVKLEKEGTDATMQDFFTV